MICSNLIVLELANVLAGPSVGMFFAELGARVIKIENKRSGGDVTRRWKRPAEGEDITVSAYFSAVNWGKECIALDLTNSSDYDHLMEWVAQADVVISSYKPGDAEALRVDYTSLLDVKSDLIYGSITGYGPDDPRAGYDAVIQAESGFMYMNGESGGPPLKMPVALMDILAGHQLKEGLLCALWERERSGRGDHVQVSLMDAAVASLANQSSNYLVTSEIPQRQGSEHPNIVPYGTVFTTSDNVEIVLAIGTDAQFQAFCDLIGRTDIASDDRFENNRKRVLHRDQLMPELRRAIRLIDRASLMQLCQDRHVPVAPVNDMAAVMQTESGKRLRIGKNGDGIRTTVFRSLNQTWKHDLNEPPEFPGD